MKIAVVTGISSGIGEAFTASLLDLGYLVFGGARNESSISHPNLIDIELDIRKEDSVISFYDEVAKKTEVVDVLVNCAGVSDMSLIKDTNAKDFLNNFTTNTYGTFLMLKHFEDFIIEDESKVYNILSSTIKDHNEGTLSYSVAESAKATVSQILKKEWSKYNLSITDLIIPATNTSLWDDYEGVDREYMLSTDKLKYFFKEILSLKSDIKISQLELTL